ncbi:methyl-accepting chemotaxis protein [Sulfuriferula nivalis]|uniref:Methyl-accepting chemotaxis protein I n=1 Tax=Sulfuriferula nivalis TaxID=2675298 RepID=A0A809SIM4_9PROT|nr:methyl-accepting chemotaxis protein [Sulfuriferula nivalis]BBP02140.1 methyl-accepting chemotaxis protein I [Sulfuriferula nivalis]
MLQSLKIKNLLIAAIMLLSAILIIIGGFGLYNQSTTNDALKSVYEDRTVCIGQLDLVIRGLANTRLATTTALLEPTEANIQKQLANIDEKDAMVEKEWAAYTSTYLTPDEQKLADQFTIDRKKYLEEGLHPLVAALKDPHKLGDAIKINGDMPNLFEPLRKDVNALIQIQLDVAKALYTSSQHSYTMSKYFAISSIVLGVLMAVGFGMFLIRAISVPLEEAIRIASSVANGDLSQKVEINSSNEFGQLLQALKKMTTNLVDIVSEVRVGTESIASASAQIAAGNLDLSNRTEAQAGSLEETASAMEELTSTVKQNADNARQANQLAETASQVASKGGAVVSDVVNTMSEINDSARKIADIIGVIDGIAFQTNILALNAAVEAARAGEQGRGFAVVATEVRSLAQRSAAAAKEIKALIDDSVDKVEQGNKQAAQAGSTMNEVVNSVQRVTDIMSEISAASREQSQGIEEVNQAITQMDETTQQNAALVEQAAAAAKSLQDQAANLEGLVNQFQLSNTSSHSRLGSSPKNITPRPGQLQHRHGHPQLSAASTPFDINTAIAAHGEWKNKLRTAILQKTEVDAATLSADNCCGLGKWLYGEGKSQFGRLPEFDKVVSAHAQFHKEAGKVAYMINAEDYAKATKALDSGTAYAKASNNVSTAIMALRRSAGI